MNLPPAPSSSGRRGVRIAFVSVLLAGLFVYLQFGPRAERVISYPNPPGYYGLMTDAFLAGQAHLRAKPDPGLKLLKNPWAGNQGVPRLHDAVYFNDRYYLYFSPVPALLISLPWRLATGEFLTDGAIAWIAASVALVLGGWLLLRLWRQWFDGLGWPWFAAGLLLVCVGSGMPVLVSAHDVYPVPGAAAAALTMAALLTLGRALTVEAKAAAAPLAWTSLLWGLAVACRPNQLFGLIGVGIAMLCLMTIAARKHGPRPALVLLLAGLGPATAIGAALAAYNYVRFGSFTEFGTSYMFAAGDQRTMEMFSFRPFLANLEGYALRRPIYGPYFPFVGFLEPGFGFLRAEPLVALALVWPLTLLHRPFRTSLAWVCLGLTLLIAAGCNLAFVCLLPTANERYRADFMPAAIMLGLLTLYALLIWSSRHARARRVAGLGLGLVAAWTLLHDVLLTFAHNPRPETLRGFAQAVNQPTAAFERARGIEFGPALLRVRFPTGRSGHNEPLVVSGSGRDVLYVSYLSDTEIQFGFHHTGAGGPVSDSIAIDPGAEYEIQLDLGCFYPPIEHPVFAGWSVPRVRRLQRQLTVSLDGKPVIASGSNFYPSHPGDLHLLQNPGDFMAPGKFTGQVISVRRVGLPAPSATPTDAEGGPLRLTVRFPEFRHFHNEPLISTGHQGEGDLLFVTYLADGKLRFGHDAWGMGAIQSPSVDYKPNEPQQIEVDMPSLYFQRPKTTSGRFILRYNGEVLLVDDRTYHRSEADELVVGFNGSESTAAAMNFSGKIDAVEKIAPLATPDEAFQVGSGPARLVLNFSQVAPGRNEPLLVTGRTGAADLVFVRYLDSSHIQIGYDHWNKGGPLSDPIPIDYASTHTLEIQLGSLYPPADDARWGEASPAERAAAASLVVVKLNGEVVLRHREEAYPAQPGEIVTGLNPVGASTAERLFTGRIRLRERVGLRILAE